MKLQMMKLLKISGPIFRFNLKRLFQKYEDDLIKENKAALIKLAKTRKFH